MLPLYAKLFDLILETGLILEKWVVGMIKPIFINKIDPMNPENYSQLPGETFYGGFKRAT